MGRHSIFTTSKVKCFYTDEVQVPKCARHIKYTILNKDTHGRAAYCDQIQVEKKGQTLLWQLSNIISSVSDICLCCHCCRQNQSCVCSIFSFRLKGLWKLLQTAGTQTCWFRVQQSVVLAIVVKKSQPNTVCLNLMPKWINTEKVRQFQFLRKNCFLEKLTKLIKSDPEFSKSWLFGLIIDLYMSCCCELF